jgi:pimeloyl-ACP methyl ester carboxylesterase
MTLIGKILKWAFWGIASLLVVVVVGGRAYQVVAEARDLEQFPPPGRLVEIEGSQMHIHCLGEGSPTVVFEQGLGSVNATWQHIFDAVSSETRICYYDRVGNGYSEPTGGLTRSPEIARRLHELLLAVGENRELVLVGWSAGGVYIREYFKQYPELVRGMVLVDASHEQQGLRLPRSGEGGQNTLFVIAQYLAPIGLVRLSGLVEAQSRRVEMPDDIRARAVARYNTSHAVQTQLLDSDAFELDINSSEPPASLGDLPLIVLSRGAPLLLDESATPEEQEYERESRRVHDELQREQAALSSYSRHIIATESGHGVHNDQPLLLIRAVKDMVAMVRAQ